MIDVDSLTGPARTWAREANIPRRFEGMRLGDLDLSGYDRSHLRELNRWLDSVIGGHNVGTRDSYGLLLTGDPGHGKTALACAMATEIIYCTWPSVFQQQPHTPYRPVYFTSFADYIAGAQALMNLHRDDDRFDELTLIAQGLHGTCSDPGFNVQVLFLDDLGAEYSGPNRWNASEFATLLRARYNKGLVTVITSNLVFERPDDLISLTSIYGVATADVLCEITSHIPIVNSGGSFRQLAS